MKLKRDIYSKFKKGWKYGNAGDDISIIGTVIVKNKFGATFPVNADDLLNEDEKVEITERIINKIPAKKQNKISPIKTTLF